MPPKAHFSRSCSSSRQGGAFQIASWRFFGMSGFSLVELLMCVGIVATLAALLVPTISKIQRKGQSATCMNNLKSIGSAFQLYSIDNDGLFPAVRYKEGKYGNQNPTKKEWPFEINPYLEATGKTFVAVSSSTSAKGVFCPEFLKEFRTKYTDAWTAGYGMNPNLGTGGNSWDDRPRVVAIPKPSSTVLAGDSDSFHLNVQTGNEWAAGPDSEERFTSGDPIRHGTSANYLFVDGHVASMVQIDAEDVLKSVQP